jgi:DNA-binding NarL/FixJ family response regulator
MIRILIADDHAILRAGLKHLLSDTTDIVVAGEASTARRLVGAQHAVRRRAARHDDARP